MHCYENANGEEQQYKTSKTQVFLFLWTQWSWQNRNWPLIWSTYTYDTYDVAGGGPIGPYDQIPDSLFHVPNGFTY